MQFPDGPATVTVSRYHMPLDLRKAVLGDEPESGDLPKILSRLREKSGLGKDDGKSMPLIGCGLYFI